MINYCKILNDADNIAVVGFSRNPNRTSRHIAEYLRSKGYNVCAVNPGIQDDTVDGFPVYRSLTEIPVKIDIVDVFRKSEDIPGVIPDVLAVNPKVLWLQLGIRNDSAVEPVADAGITVIQDECILVKHQGCF